MSEKLYINKIEDFRAVPEDYKGEIIFDVTDYSTIRNHDLGYFENEIVISRSCTLVGDGDVRLKAVNPVDITMKDHTGLKRANGKFNLILEDKAYANLEGKLEGSVICKDSSVCTIRTNSVCANDLTISGQDDTRISMLCNNPLLDRERRDIKITFNAKDNCNLLLYTKSLFADINVEGNALAILQSHHLDISAKDNAEVRLDTSKPGTVVKVYDDAKILPDKYCKIISYDKDGNEIEVLDKNIKKDVSEVNTDVFSEKDILSGAVEIDMAKRESEENMNDKAIDTVNNNVITEESKNTDAINDMYKVSINENVENSNVSAETNDKELSIEDKITMAKDSNINIDNLKELSEDDNWKVKVAAASNEKSTPKMLDKLSEEKANAVKIEVAKNLNTDSDSGRNFNTLEKLSSSIDTNVRIEVAKNPNASREVFETLSDDKSAKVKIALLSNENIPTDIVSKLSNDSNEIVSDKAQDLLEIKGIENLMNGSDVENTSVIIDVMKESIDKLSDDDKAEFKVILKDYIDSSGEEKIEAEKTVLDFFEEKVFLDDKVEDNVDKKPNNVDSKDNASQLDNANVKVEKDEESINKTENARDIRLDLVKNLEKHNSDKLTKSVKYSRGSFSAGIVLLDTIKAYKYNNKYEGTADFQPIKMRDVDTTYRARNHKVSGIDIVQSVYAFTRTNLLESLVVTLFTGLYHVTFDDVDKSDTDKLIAEQKYELAKDSSTPSSVLDDMSKDGDVKLKVLISSNKNSSPQTLDKLSKSEFIEVVRGVGSNPNSAKGTLYNIVNKESDTTALYNVSRNINAGPEALSILSNDKNEFILINVAKHENTPMPVVEKLFNSDITKVSASAVTNPIFCKMDERVLEKAATCKNDIVKAAFGECSTTPRQYLESMAKDDKTSSEVKLAIIKNIKCPREIKEDLAKDSDPIVAKAAENSISKEQELEIKRNGTVNDDNIGEDDDVVKETENISTEEEKDILDDENNNGIDNNSDKDETVENKEDDNLDNVSNEEDNSKEVDNSDVDAEAKAEDKTDIENEDNNVDNDLESQDNDDKSDVDNENDINNSDLSNEESKNEEDNIDKNDNEENVSNDSNDTIDTSTSDTVIDVNNENDTSALKEVNEDIENNTNEDIENNTNEDIENNTNEDTNEENISTEFDAESDKVDNQNIDNDADSKESETMDKKEDTIDVTAAAEAEIQQDTPDESVKDDDINNIKTELENDNTDNVDNNEDKGKENKLESLEITNEELADIISSSINDVFSDGEHEYSDLKMDIFEKIDEKYGEGASIGITDIDIKDFLIEHNDMIENLDANMIGNLVSEVSINISDGDKYSYNLNMMEMAEAMPDDLISDNWAYCIEDRNAIPEFIPATVIEDPNEYKIDIINDECDKFSLEDILNNGLDKIADMVDAGVSKAIDIIDNIKDNFGDLVANVSDSVCLFTNAEMDDLVSTYYNHDLDNDYTPEYNDVDKDKEIADSSTMDMAFNGIDNIEDILAAL